MRAERVVDGDSTAKQGRGVFAAEGIWNGDNEAGVGANTLCVAAVAVDAGAFRGGTKVLHATNAPLAFAAGVGLPAEADALAYGEGTHTLADRGNGSDDFMAGNKGILADAPVVGDEMNIAMTDAAVRDGDLHLLRAESARVVAVGQQFGPCCVHCESLYSSHDRSDVLTEG